MDMPKPGAAHAALNVFAGTWVGKERMPPSPWAPQETIADGHIVNKPSLGGFSIVQDYTQSSGKEIRYQGHGVFTWDGQANEYKMYWFDSMGSPINEFRGGHKGNVWTFACKHGMGHTRSIWEFTGTDRYRHTMEVSPDGKTWSTFMDGSYAKAAS
jgi:hypothetical protein